MVEQFVRLSQDILYPCEIRIPTQNVLGNDVLPSIICIPFQQLEYFVKHCRYAPIYQ